MSNLTSEFQNLLTNFDLASVTMLLVKFTILLAIVLVFYRLTKKRAASFRHAVLGVGVLFTPLLLTCHMFFPGWSITVPEFAAFERMAQAPIVTTQTETEPDSLATDPFTPGLAADDNIGFALECGDANQFNNEAAMQLPVIAQEPCQQSPVTTATKTATQPVLSFFGFAALIWIFITSWLLIRLATAWCFMASKIRRAPIVDANQLASYGVPTSLALDLVANNIRVRVSRSREQMPLGVGLIRKTILLPRGCRKWTPLEWQSVLLHEKAHFDRRDCWINLAARIQQSLLWFHPLSSLLLKMIRSESEFACDDRVLASGISRVDYAEVLLQMASAGRYQRSANLVSVTMSESAPLESRMSSILNDTTPRRPTSRLSLLLMASVISLLLVPLATAQLLPLASQPTAEIEPATNPVATDQPQESEAEPLFNVLLRAGEKDTTYGGEFLATCDETLSIKTEADRIIEIEFADVDEIYHDRFANASGYRGTIVHLIDGTIVQGKIDKSIDSPITNDSLVFHLDNASSLQDATRTIAPADIYRLRRVKAAALQAGTVTSGVATSKLSYHLRAPEALEEKQHWPALVILHRNYSDSKAYIDSIVATWPELAERYVLIGIDGEQFTRPYAEHAERPSFAYTGLSFVGKGANFRGFQGTDRESPAPIAEAIIELRQRFNFSKLFLAGHGSRDYTSGGNNAYHIQTYFPDVTDGVVVVAGASLVQCNVVEFKDPEIRAAQRKTPLVILEPAGKSSTSGNADWAYEKYMDNGFPMLKYLKEGAGQNFADFPIDKAIAWLERITAQEPEEALRSVRTFISEGNPRDANALAHRFHSVSQQTGQRDPDLQALTQVTTEAFEESQERVDQLARFEELLERSLESGEGVEDWFDDFIEFRKAWEFSPATQALRQRFDELRAEQNAPAKKIYNQARAADKEKSNSGNPLYETIVTKHFASAYYLQAKSILDKRNGKQK